MGEIFDKKFIKYTGKDTYAEGEYEKVGANYANVEDDYASVIRNETKKKEIDNEIATLNDEKQRTNERISAIDARMPEIDDRIAKIDKLLEKLPTSPSLVDLIEADRLGTEKESFIREKETSNSEKVNLTAKNSDIDTKVASLAEEKARLMDNISALKSKHGWI